MNKNKVPNICNLIFFFIMGFLIVEKSVGEFLKEEKSIEVLSLYGGLLVSAIFLNNKKWYSFLEKVPSWLQVLMALLSLLTFPLRY